MNSAISWLGAGAASRLWRSPSALVPNSFGWTDSKGTRWRLAAIPLGGYVKFFGDNSAASTPDGDTLPAMSDAEKAVSFHYQPVWKRALTVAAGPLANFILAIVIFSAINAGYGRQMLVPRIEGVVAGSVAERAGLKAGDLDRQHRRPADRQLHGHAAHRLHLAGPVPGPGRGARRQGRRRQGRARAEGDQDAARTPASRHAGRTGLAQSADLGRSNSASAPRFRTPFTETWFIVERTGSYVGGLFAGTETTDQLSGPIRIAQVSGQVATAGIVAL